MKLTSNHSRASKVVVVTAAAALALAGCSAEEPTGADAPVVYWYALDTLDAENEALWTTYNLDPFEAEHPDVKIDAIPQSKEPLDAKIKTALAAGDGPDFIPTPGPANVIPFAGAGYLADLTENAASENWEDKFLPWALDVGYVDGKLVSVPTSYESLVMYYNESLFEENGWTPPTDRASLEKLADEMIAKDIVPFAAGNGDNPSSTEWLISSFLNQVAGPAKIHDALAGEIPWTDPSIVSAIALLKEYFEEGYFGGGVKQYFTTSYDQKLAQLADGEAAMYLSGTWETLSFPYFFGVDGNQNEWGWTTLPSLSPDVPDGVFPLAIGGTLSINADANNLPGALEYVNWLFSDTSNMWDYIAAGEDQVFPIKFSDSDVPAEVDPRYVDQYKQINSASEAGNVGYVTWTSFGPKMEAFVLSEQDKVLNGSLSPEDFCAGLQEQFEVDNEAGLIPQLFDTNA